MKIRWIVGGLVLVGMAAYWVARIPSNRPTSLEFASQAPSQANLGAEVRRFQEFVLSPKFTPENCATSLGQTYRQIFQVTPGTFDRDAVKEEAGELLKEIFRTRLLLRKRLGEFADQNKISPECLTAAREVMRGGRVLEDVLGEWALNYPKYDKKKPEPVLAGKEPWLLLNPEYQKVDFRSGDVFLSRGTAFTSAAIARITDVDANFSHLAILHVDKATGAKTMIEAHIEVGAITQSFDAYRADGKVRSVLFRHPDANLAHEAATFILNKVRDYQKKNGDNICYDFAMDVRDSSCLFCSELVSHAFAEASRNRVEIPMFLSGMTMKNRDFIERIGVKSQLTFAPADIELDPRFELVAEWRDFSRMNENHMQDAVLTSMYAWMEREDYRLLESPTAALTKHVAWHLRRWPIFGSLLREKLPKNMSKSVIGTVSTMNEVSEALFTALEKANNAHFKKTGFWLTPREMLVELEQFRQRDLQIYEKYKFAGSGPSHGVGSSTVVPAFHLLFRRP